jgi:NADH-quinone oxidoreductase subunit N
MTPDIDYLALAPEIIVAVTSVAILGLDLFLERPRKYWTGVVATIGLLVAAIPLVALAVRDEPVSMFDGSYVVDEFSLVMKGVFIAAAYLVLLMSVAYIESDRYYEGEYYFLVVASLLGALVMTSARDFIIMFVALELVTGPLLLLAGWRKADKRSNEAALKFFLIAVLSAAVLGWGMSFVYGLTGSVQFDQVSVAMAGVLADDATRAAGVLAIMFVIAGFAFKISAVPFHFWAPDTYEGAPTPVTAFLSVSSKAAGFVGLLVVLFVAFGSATEVWGPTMWVLAALTMTLGNFSALGQTNVVRLLAYSSVAQAGFMLVPFAVAAVADTGPELAEGFSATVIYLIIYAFMNLGAFAVVIAASARTGSADIDSFAGLSSRAPGLAVLGSLFFFSLAGIPPLAGWYAKLVMFRSVIGTGEEWGIVLGVIAAVNAVVAFFYYAKVVKAMWFDPTPEDLLDLDVGIAGSMRLALGLSVAMVIVLGILPGIADTLGRASAVIAGG